MTKTRSGLAALSLLTIFAACGEALPPPPGEPPPDAPPPEGRCGDGVLDPGEDCDTGGASATCDIDCTAPACGDGIINAAAGEQCDDGNAAAGDGCSECRLEECGNGRLDPGEECDAGDADGDGTRDSTAECDADCTAPLCGDGLVNPAADEQCDDGNTAAGDGCSESCQRECGNGRLDPNEECDPGDADGNGFVEPTATCDTDCTAPACGDGSFNPAAEETCDDGNNASADGCSAGCVSEISITGTYWSDFDVRIGGIWRFDGTGWQGTAQWQIAWVEDHWAAGPLDDYLVGSVSDGHGEPVLRGGEALFHHNPAISEFIELEGMLGENLYSFKQIWGTRTEPVTLYVITERSDLLRYDEAGWALVEFSGSVDVRDVWGTGPTDVYALHWNGNRFHFDGTSWTQVDDLPSIFHVMGGTGPDDMLVAARDYVARFDGTQWTEWSAGREELRIQRVASRGNGSFAVTGGSLVGIFDDGAWSFFDFTGQVKFNDVAMLPNGHVFAVGGGWIFHHDGQGWDIRTLDHPWELEPYGGYGPLTSIQFTPGPP